MNGRHLLICLALIAAAVALVGVGAGALVVVPAIACAAMMGAMIWMMVRAGGGRAS